MLTRLRKKMVLTNMLLVSTVLLCVLCAVCVLTWQNVFAEQLEALRKEAIAISLLQNETEGHPQYRSPDLPIQEHHLAVLLKEDGSWTLLQADGLTLSGESISEAVRQVMEQEDSSGILRSMDLTFLRQNTKIGPILMFGQYTSIRQNAWHNIWLSIWLFFASEMILLAISILLSRIAVKPIERAWMQQKQFIANASHELKTPLTVIMANNNIISGHPEQTVRQQEQWLHSTLEEAEQMHRLLNEMLTLARTEDEQVSFPLELINGAEIVEEEILFLEPVAFEKSIALELQAPKELCWHTNPQLLRKLVVLLVDNAIKYSPRNDTVSITLAGGKSVFLQVHNRGPAIPEEDLPHLFERFYRSDKSRSTEGYGLGLAIAHATAEKLRGRLSVTSTPETGTIFTAEFKT